jgi:ABC-type branched-subunit amino acid transport system substrate-binding protein
VKRRKWVAASAVAAVVGAFASTGIVATSTAGAGSRTDARGVTATSINVAGLGAGPNFTGPELKNGATARFAVENAKGGVFGRKINYVESADDKSDPNTDLSEAQRLVQQDQVFALVPVLTPVLQASTFLTQQHVPFFGWGINAGYCKNPYAFGFTGCIVPPADGSIPTTGTTWGDLAAAYFKSHGSPGGSKGKTAAVIAEDLDTGKTGAIVIGAQAKVSGFKVVYQKNPIPANPVPGDYSPYVNALMTSNAGKPPDVIFVTTAFQNVLGLSKALLTAGFQGLLTNAVAYDPRLVSSAKGQTVFTQFDVPEDTSNATMQQITNDIKAVSAGAPITQGTLAAYFSADSFVAALKKAGKNLTPEGLAKAMSSLTYQVPGIVGPTKYPAAQTLGAPCGLLTQSDGTKYSIVVPYGCYHDFNYKTLKPIKY